MSVLDPVVSLVTCTLAASHELLSTTGLDPHSAPAWVLSITLLVVAVRLSLLPGVVLATRAAHGAARAQPQLLELSERYRGRTDLASLQALAQERRRIRAQHRVPRYGALPALAQIPVFMALYWVVNDLAAGRAVGALTTDLVTSANSAQVLGVGLATRWSSALAAGPVQGLVVTGLVVAAALLTYGTQRWFVLPAMNRTGLPEALLHSQRVMPILSAIGVAVGGAAVPTGVLLYWVVTNVWGLAQHAAVWRWAPTPGSPAHQARTGAR